ncbi:MULTISPECIES: methyltransferase [Rhizobium]|uniref:methyltransferase n=1 Tax=Rhizobium TaxID=379 RepID=UPI001959B001|nr:MULTISPECIES: methyltransferase [Rhizobium]MBM7045996.1 methyltransferase [Rhizobium lusitanum]
MQQETFPVELAELAAALQINSEIFNANREALALRKEVESAARIFIFDHETQAETFTRAYGIKNALKCCLALLSANIDPAKYENVRDLGCGSGVFGLTFAFLAANPMLRLTFVDQSPLHLNIAQTVMADSGCAGSFSFLNQTLPPDLPSSSDLDLISYWFCENGHVASDANLIDRLIGREAIIVDYEKVISGIVDHIPKYLIVKDRWSVESDVPLHMRDIVGDESVRSYGIHIVRA